MNTLHASRDSSLPLNVEWGYLLENAKLILFSQENQTFIERNYLKCKVKTSEAYVTIHDTNLPPPHTAKVYIGVDKNHLRMPGTRYHVHRKEKNSTKPHPFAATISPSSNSRCLLQTPSIGNTTSLGDSNCSNRSRPIRKRNVPLTVETARKTRKPTSNHKESTRKTKPMKNSNSNSLRDERMAENSSMLTPASLPLSSPPTYMSASFGVPSPTSSTTTAIATPSTGTAVLGSVNYHTATKLNSLITDPALVAILSSPGSSDDNALSMKIKTLEPLSEGTNYSSFMPTTVQHQDIHTVNTTTSMTAVTASSTDRKRIHSGSNTTNNNTISQMTSSLVSPSHGLSGQEQYQQQWETLNSMTTTRAATATRYGTAPCNSLDHHSLTQKNNHSAALLAASSSSSSSTTTSTRTTTSTSTMTKPNNNESLQQQLYIPAVHDRELCQFLFSHQWDNYSYHADTTSNNDNKGSTTTSNNVTVSWSSYVPISY